MVRGPARELFILAEENCSYAVLAPGRVSIRKCFRISDFQEVRAKVFGLMTSFTKRSQDILYTWPGRRG